MFGSSRNDLLMIFPYISLCCIPLKFESIVGCIRAWATVEKDQLSSNFKEMACRTWLALIHRNIGVGFCRYSLCSFLFGRLKQFFLCKLGSTTRSSTSHATKTKHRPWTRSRVTIFLIFGHVKRWVMNLLLHAIFKILLDGIPVSTDASSTDRLKYS